MALNTNIAMGFQPPQIESPVNAMVRMAQLQNATQENELNALRAKGLTRELAEAENWSNALRSGVDYNTPEGMNRLMAANPSRGLDLMGKLRQQQKDESDIAVKRAEVADKTLGMYRQALSSIQSPEEMAQWYGHQYNNPLLTNTPVRAHSLENKIAAIPRDPAAFQTFKAQVEMGMDKWLDRNRGVPLAAGGMLASPTQYGTTAAPLPPTPNIAYLPGAGDTPGQLAVVQANRSGGSTVQLSPLPAGVGSRVPPLTPKVEKVLDPTTGQEILVDVNTYVPGTGLGAKGVIGPAAPTPAAQKAAEKKAQDEKARQTSLDALKEEMDNTLFHYQELNRLKAIPSTERGSLSNLSASMGASGAGQVVGRMLGTEEQKNRDIIQGSRLRLLNAVSKILGVKSGQLNSNVELQTYLKSLSDPSQSIEAVQENMRGLEAFIQRELGKAPATSTSRTAGAPAAGVRPSLDSIFGGK